MTHGPNTQSKRTVSHRANQRGLLRAALVACALASFLAAAPAARASKAVIGTFGTPAGEGAGQLFLPKGVAVNRSGTGGAGAGDVYVADSKNNRIEEFSAAGAFVRAFGYDVVQSGQDNSGANEQQMVTVDASGGSFTLAVTKNTFAAITAGSNVATNIIAPISAFHVGDVVSGGVPAGTTITAVGSGSLTLSANATSTFPQGNLNATETTAAIPFNATAAQLEAALVALPAIGAGNVAVTGGPGATAPLTIEYTGALGHDDVAQMSANSSALSGGAHTAAIATTIPGGGPEVCNALSSPTDVCKAGPEVVGAGALFNPNGVAIDQSNGNVYVTDLSSDEGGTFHNRIDAFSATGAFEGAFGWHVNATNPEEKLQFCTLATGCQAGTQGSGAGQFSRLVESLPAVDPSDGHLYVPDGGSEVAPPNSRINEFAPTLNGSGEVTGASFVRAVGWDVVASGPDNIPAVNAVQMLSIPATVTGGTFTLSFEGSTTGPLPSNVGFTALRAALNGLSSVKGPGIVSAAEEPIHVVPIGAGKWELVFAENFEDVPLPLIGVDNKELKGGEATTTFISEGVSPIESCDVAANPSDVCKAGVPGSRLGQFSLSDPAASVAVDSSGAIYGVDRGDFHCTYSSGFCRVLKFDQAGTAAEEFAPGQLTSVNSFGSLLANAVSPTDVAVDPANDHVLVAKKEGTEAFRFFEFDSSGTLLDSSPAEGAVLNANSNPIQHGLAIGNGGRFYFTNPLGMVDVFGPAPAPSVSIGAVTNVGSTTATFHGTVTPPPPVAGQGFDTTYHFEYLTDLEYQANLAASRPPFAGAQRFPAGVDVDVGDGSGAGSPTTCPANNPPTCEVQQTAIGLQPNAGYQVRLVAGTGTAATSGIESFTTEPAPPSVSGAAAEEVGETSAKLVGLLNPNSEATIYHFEWGTDTEYGNRIPAEAEEAAGSGGKMVKVSADLAGLSATTTYHFRLVASNGSGQTKGPDREFVTLDAAGLPDGRGFELVSPANKRPQGSVSAEFATLSYQSSADGNSFLFPIYNGLLDSTVGGSVSYLASRGAGGWESAQVSPPSLIQRPRASLDTPAKVNYFSSDLSCGLVESPDPLSAEVPAADTANGIYNLFRRNADGSFTLLSSNVPDNPSVGSGAYRVAGASPDCQRVYFKTAYHLLAGASGLYEWDQGTLRDAGLLHDGTVPGGGVGIGAQDSVGETGSRTNSVSRDGSRFFFNAISDEGADAGKRAVFVRIDGANAVDASQSTTATADLGARYETASPDGSHVFFTANYGLTPESSSGVASCNAGGEGCDLYGYDVDTGQLKDLSADSNPADPKGAGVIGVVAVSEDGSHVYFATRGQLIPGKGKTYAQNLAGTRSVNIYTSDAGQLSYVASVGDQDLVQPHGPVQASYNGLLIAQPYDWTAQTTPDGRYLIFTASSNVTGYVSGGARELYRYSALADETICISCRPDGQPSVATSENEPIPGATKSQLHYSRTISEDGRRIFFIMPDALAPGAQSGNDNVYEWEEGQIYTLTSQHPLFEGRVLESSPSGNDVFIVDERQLAPQDTDFTFDVYDIRAPHSRGEKIGFPVPKPPVPCDPLSDQCQGEAGPQPAPGAGAASAGFSGPGNVTSPPHKKHHHKRKRHHRKAQNKRQQGKRAINNNRGGAK